MQRSELAIILFLVAGLMPTAASAQQIAPDANQAPAQLRPERTPQQSDQTQSQSSPVQPDRTPFSPRGRRAQDEMDGLERTEGAGVAGPCL